MVENLENKEITLEEALKHLSEINYQHFWTNLEYTTPGCEVCTKIIELLKKYGFVLELR